MEQNQTTDNTDGQKRTNKLKLTWGLICLIGPSALIIVSLLLYAVFNFMLGASSSDQSTVSTIINIALYIVGVISILTWLPAVVIGIVLLATRKKVQ